MAKTYVLNESWVEDVTFKVGGAPTDPSTFTATVTKPDGTAASPVVTSPSTGVRRVTTDLDQAGDWYLHAVGTGTAKGAFDTYIHVRRSEAPGANLLAEAMVTVADMRFFLDRTGMSADLDELRWLEDLINTYSLACAGYVGRQFTPERTPPMSGGFPTRPALQADALATGVTKRFAYDGSGYVSFAPYEVRTVTLIVLGPDLPASQQRTLFAGDTTRDAEYRLEPAAKSKLYTYLWANLPTRAELAGYPARAREVAVTGDWGAPGGTVPENAKMACKIAVGQAFRNPEDYRSRVAAGMSIEEATAEGSPLPGSLPGESMGLLTEFRRT